MGLIIQSFFLSFRVSGHIIIPLFIVGIISDIVASLLGLAFGGYSQIIVGPAASVFYTLFGIRIALKVMGDHSLPAYDSLILASVVYGVIMSVTQFGVVVLSEVTVLLYAGVAVNVPALFQELPIQFFDFDLGEDWLKIRLSQVLTLVFVFEVIMAALLAVPMAGAARAGGKGTAEAGFFDGFGRSFVPLCFIIAVAFVMKTVFGIFGAVFGILPAIMYVISILTATDWPSFDTTWVLYGFGAMYVTLFAYAWVFTASALALKKADGVKKRANRVAAAQSTIAEDMRALRKSRE